MNKVDKVLTPKATLMYPNLFEPTSFESGKDETYNAILVFSKGTDLTEIKAAVSACGKAKGLKAGARNPLRDGNEKVDDWGELFRDAVYVRVSSKFQPAVVDARKADILDKDAVYSGNIVRAVIRPYAYDNKGNSGVSFGLDAIQVLEAGQPLGGSKAAVSMFDAVEGDAPESDPFA